MSGIYWLASYPKSGNTWMRVFLAALRAGVDTAVDINEMGEHPIATARAIFDDAVGIESSDLTPDEIDALRPDAYAFIASQAAEDLFIKVHDAFTTANGRPMLGGGHVKGAIYILRNPLDVVVSLASHIGRTIDEAVTRLNDPEYGFTDAPDVLSEQLRQRLFCWSRHVLSWVDAEGVRVHVMRYEDMTLRPVETFGAAAEFLGFRCSSEQIHNALERSSLKEMQRMEQEGGFRERSPHAKVFFGRGKVGGYRDVLTVSQIARVVRCHEVVMRRFGYIGAGGELIW